MLSVLVPIYNINVHPLVSELQTQLAKSGVDYEIILADDASSDGSIREHNGLLAELGNVTYIQHERNFGRSASRNELADEARYPFLLFIDCDARVKKECYIAHYLHFISLKKDHIPEFAVSGGLSYRDNLPERSKHLRYKYGLKREVRSAKERNEHPYSHFTPFNLLISKSVFGRCRFDESLTDYGYEDTFFGLALEEAEIPMYHIDNELYHDGLDDNRDFLRKIEASVGNLARFYRDGLVDNRFREQSRLLQTWEHLRAKRNGKAIFKALHWMKRPFTNLILRHNSLKALDLYKLMLFDDFVDH